MKKIHIILWSGFLLIGALTSCTTDTDADSGKPGMTAPLYISSARTSGVDTKSTTTLSTGTLGIFRLLDSAANLDAFANALYTASAGVWSATNGDVNTALTTEVCAYSPYNASYTDATQLPLPSWIGLTSDAPSHDLLYSLPTTASSVSDGLSTTSFTLNHAYALLRFTLNDSGGSSNANTVTSFSVYSKNLPASSTLNITGTSVAYGAITTQPTSQMTATVNQLLSNSPVIDVLLPPCTLYDASNTTLDATIVIDGVQMRINLDLATNNIKDALVAGKIYPININIKLAWPESNCYIVAPGATIYIPVSRATAGNFANFASGASFTTGLLWSDVSDTHVTATVEDRYIKVVAGDTEGNSVVYAKNINGDIVWSWHLWVTGYRPGSIENTDTNTTSYSYNGNLWMDRNLGAISTQPGAVGTLGLLYQWGRKDPFPGSSSVSNNTSDVTIYGEKTSINISDTGFDSSFLNSIQYPLTYYVGSSEWHDGGADDDALWYDGSTTKTIYDPCPIGWRVPFYIDAKSPWDGLSGGIWNFGFSWTSPNIGYYPASGYRLCVDGGLHDVGIYGRYWSALMNHNLTFCDGGGIFLSEKWFNADGYNVRCVKELK